MAHSPRGIRRRVLLALTLPFSAAILLMAPPAHAANSSTVPLGTAADYSVLASSTVTNTNASVLAEDLGLSPGSSITGFPPGTVTPPATTNQTNAAAAQAQSDLTAAYINAAGRPIDATTTADLGNLHLGAGVYAGPSHGALQLTGPLVLDGAGDRSSVFIFQTNSSLTTASSSTVSLVNGAQACNVFWQVGSSATLGTGSVFSGNILALASVTVTNSVTVHGRALARTGAVTLDDDTFTTPSCATNPVAPTTTTTPATTTPTTPTTAPGGAAATPGASGSSGTGTGSGSGTGSGAPPVAGPPRTDAIPLHQTRHEFPWLATLLGISLAIGVTTATTVRKVTRHPIEGA